MSQAGMNNSSGGGGGGENIQSLTPDSGGVVTPVANNIDLFTTAVSSNNNNGIQSVNGGAGVLDVELTNFLQGQVTTANATPTNIITFALSAIPGVYSVSGTVVAFDITDTAGGACDFSIAFRSTGAAVQIIGSTVDNVFLEPSLATADISVSSSGNSFLLGVVGVAGKTIDWNASFNYRFVS